MGKVKKLVLKLNSKKSSIYGGIPASILKRYIEVHLKYLMNTINHYLKESAFHDESKQSILVYKNLTHCRRRITDQLVYYHMYQESLRE